MAATHAQPTTLLTEPDGPAFDAIPVPMAWLGADLSIARANAAFAELIGAHAASLVGEVLGHCLRSAASGVPDSDGIQTFEFQCADGPRWMRLDLQPLGEGFLAVLADVSGERTILERMRADLTARERLKQDAAIGLWRYDPDAKAYHFQSEISQGHAGAAAPVPLAHLQLIQHPDDRDIDTAIRDRLTREEGSAEAELRYLTAEGAWWHSRVVYRSGRRLKSGLYELYGLSQNVTALAEARDAATTNAQKLNLALMAAGAGVCGIDLPDGKFWASQEFQDLLGPDAMRDAFAANDPRVAFHPDDQPRLAGLTERSAEADRAVAVEARLLCGGEYRWMRAYWLTERDTFGRPTRGVGLLIDIDDQKRQELALTQARQLAESATASKSSFLASVSHEIRTPMNGIVGVLNRLKREALSVEGRDLLGEALACSDMLAQLIDDVLDFSKMEAGKLEVTPVATDPVAVMDSVIALLQPQADTKNLYLRASADAIGWRNIDPVRLRQCLFNVVGNAVKFTETGGVEVRMCLVGDADDPSLRVEVQDTGVGVPQTAKDALFDRFQQAHSGPSRRFGGTGLGLAISRNLSRMMGGDMGFTSVEGEGSTFWFEISAPPAEAQAEVAPTTIAEREPLAGLRILVVDDNRTNRLVGLKSLEALGAYAETADSGEAAIAATVSGGYDLVLMDVNMPGMDGLEATRRIRALPGREAQVPIVALTADVMTHHQQAYTDAGMNGFVPKPFSPLQLLTEIARLAC